MAYHHNDSSYPILKFNLCEPKCASPNVQQESLSVIESREFSLRLAASAPTNVFFANRGCLTLVAFARVNVPDLQIRYKAKAASSWLTAECLLLTNSRTTARPRFPSHP